MKNLLVSVIAGVFAAADVAAFYALADLWLGYLITWPIVLAVYWSVQMAWYFEMKRDLEDAGL